MTKPISPSEVYEQKLKNWPSEVFDVWNRLIADNFDGESSVILQKDAAKALKDCTRDNGFGFSMKYLYIEEIYRQAGWKVHYEKAAYNETFDSYYEFSKK